MTESQQNNIEWTSNYSKLLCYQKSVVIYDLTYHFCNRYIDTRDRTFDQMIQAARSGKQNIVEGYADLTASKEMGIKLFNVARASHLELLEDYRDYLRTRKLREWAQGSEEDKALERITKTHSESAYYLSLAESRDDEVIANIAIKLIHQATHLTSRYIDKVVENFATEGGFREKMTRIRVAKRQR